MARATSERIGTYTFRGRAKSRRLMGAITHSESEQRRPLMLPQEVKELSPEKAIIFAEYLSPIMARKLRYHNHKGYLQRAQVPAPVWPARPRTVRRMLLTGPATHDSGRSDGVARTLSVAELQGSALVDISMLDTATLNAGAMVETPEDFVDLIVGRFC